MNEVRYEETAFPYDYSKQKIYYIILRVILGVVIAGTVLFAFLSFLAVPLNEWLGPLIFIVWWVGFIVLLEFFKTKLYNCYDFIFISGDVRIIKVVNTRKRKKMIIFDSKDVFQIGRYDSETYRKIKNTPGIKTIFAPTNKSVVEAQKFYIATVLDGVKYLVVLECTEKFLRYILQYCGKPVLEKEY
ncbi:MAG: hypothetical protein IJR61_02615 [Clostridia bacterium]|nr:hypothetical protein [Clostridia bacterium]